MLPIMSLVDKVPKLSWEFRDMMTGTYSVQEHDLPIITVNNLRENGEGTLCNSDKVPNNYYAIVLQ